VKTVEVRIMQLSPYGSTITLVFAGKVLSRNSKGGCVSNEGGVGKTSHFLAVNINIPKTVGEIRPKLLLMTNMKLHERFRLAPRPMTLNCYKFEFSDNSGQVRFIFSIAE